MHRKPTAAARGLTLVLGLVTAVFLGGCRHKQKDVEPRPSVEELTQQTQSTDKDDRYVAVKAAGDQAPDNKDAIPLLISALSDKDPSVRWVATKGLEQFGAAADAAVPRLISLLHDPDSTVRAGAARALSTMGIKGSGAIPELSNAQSDPVEEVREEAQRAVKALQRVQQFQRSNANSNK